MTDKTYRRMAEAFSFGQQSEKRQRPDDFADRIVAGYISNIFENQVGESDNNLRLALYARRELASLAARPSTSDTKWYEVLGDTPLRKVFSTAFGFGAAYGQLPIDRQHEEFREAAWRMFGSEDMGQFTDPDKVETLITRFLARSAVTQNTVANRYSTALAILTGR